MSNAIELFYRNTLLLIVITVTVFTVPYREDVKLSDIAKNSSKTKIESENVNYRLPVSLRPEAYVINFELDSDGRNFSGHIKIDVKVIKTTSEIKLHRGLNLTVDFASIIIVSEKRDIVPTKSHYDNKTEILTYILPIALQKNDKVEVNLKFTGLLGDNMIGFYRSTYVDQYGNEKWVAATQFEATYARRAFPCFDEPAFKANFTIMISKLNLPEGYHCLSNMPLSSKSTRDTCIFEKSLPMSTYLVAFIVSDFKNKTVPPVTIWTRDELVSQADYASNISLKALETFERLFGENYTLTKMDLVAVPDFSAGAMENWGLLTFREANLLYDDDDSTSSAKQRLASVIVHECAHMWFGDLVTPRWWGYLWLSEAFARYFQYMTTAQCEKKWRMEEQFVVEQYQSAMGVDALEDSKPMTREVSIQSDVEAMGDSITYNKGASILRMIEQTFGSDIFYSALRKYLKLKKFSNASPTDLWGAFQEEIKKNKDKNHQINLTEYMKSWTDQPGFPYVKVTVESDQIVLSQRRFLLYNFTEICSNTTWSIPVTWLSSVSKKPSTKPEFWFNQTEVKVKNKINATDWLILNVNSTGFYRVLYDNESWKKIIDILTQGDFLKIPVLNRAAIMDDLLNFARAELVSYDVALSALRYLKRETDYLSFKTAFTSLDHLIKKFSINPNYGLFKDFIVTLFSTVYEKLTYDDKKEDTHLDILLRKEINNKACNFDLSDCINRSKKYFFEWKKNKKFVPKNQRSAAYCAAIKHGSAEDWEFLLEEYKKSKVATEQLIILNALGCSKNVTKLEKYLLNALTLNYTESLIRKQDISTVFSAVYSSVEGADYMLDFVEKHFQHIYNYYKSYDEIGNIVSGVLKNYPIRKFIRKVQKMMKNDANYLNTVKESLKKSIKLAEYEQKWFNKHFSAIIEWIKKNTEENTVNYRLPLNVYPKSYAIHLSPKFEPDFIFGGRVEIEARIRNATDRVVLHTDQLTINKKNIFISLSDNNIELYDVIDTFYSQKYNFYTIVLSSIVNTDAFINITILYSGYLNTEMRGFYRSSYDILGERRWLAATQLEPVGARRLFPCFDEPHLKATFKITVNAPENYHVLSNTAVKRRNSNVWEFETTPRMSSYLVAVIVSDFKAFHSEHDKFTVWANPLVVNQSAYSVSLIKPIIDNFEQRLQVKYHLKKLDMVALPDFASGAMENWGLITARETALLYDKLEMSSLAAKQNIRNIVAHEIAHQWFGNLVSPAWWDYVWLNEGFARYFPYFLYTEAEASWNLEAQFVVDHLHKSLATDATSNTHPITHKVYSPVEIKGLFDTISYAKAASIIRMLEKLIGSKKFYAALKRYFEVNKLSSAEPLLLFDAFEKENINFNVTEFMTNWTIQSGFPVIKVDIKRDTVTLTQTRFSLKPKSNLKKNTYIIPITYATDKNTSFNHTQNVVTWLKEKSVNLTIPNADRKWVIFNVQQMGYYRVNYDEASWHRIFNVLNSNNFTKIHEINRAMIINDLFNLARAGQLSYEMVFTGLKYLQRETEYVPWKAAKIGFAYLTHKFYGNPAIYNFYRTYVLDLLQPTFKKLQFNDKYNDKHTHILLRKLILDWMCSLDDEKCIKEAKDVFHQQCKIESNFTIPPNKKAFVYCTAIRHGNQDDWNYLKKKFLKTNYATEKINILTALGCSQKQDNLKSLLIDTIKSGSYIRLQDVKKVFTYVISGGPVGVAITLDFIKEHYNEIKDNFGGESNLKTFISAMSKRLSSVELMEKFKKFTKNALENMPPISKFLENIYDNMLYEHKWYDDKLMKILEILKLNSNHGRLPKNIQPTKYAIFITPYFEERNFTFDGKAEIRIRVDESTSVIVIHIYKLEIKKIVLDNLTIKLCNTTYDESEQKLFINLEKKIVAGTEATLLFEYIGQLRDDQIGFFKSSYIDQQGKKKWIAATQFKSTFARSVFPSFDEPSFKATFEINIANPNGYHTISNMGLRPKNLKDKESNRIWDKHEETELVSSDLIAFVISDFVPVNAENSNVTVWTRRELREYCIYASAAGHSALEFLKNKLGAQYSMPEINFVSVPDFSGATEVRGLVMFGENELLYDIDKMSVKHRSKVNNLISHALVNIWLGTLVISSRWVDLRLNEGIAKYLSYIVGHENEKSWKQLEQFVVNELHVVLNIDEDESLNFMNNEFSDEIRYKKLASVLRMFHNSFGDKDFFFVLQKYLANNECNNTSCENLMEQFENHYINSNKTLPGRPEETITAIMNSWIEQKGYPVVTAKREGNNIELHQEQFLISSKSENASKSNNVYWIPITYTSNSEKDFKNVEPKIWLGKSKKTVEINSSDSWFIVNIQQVGCYRVNYDNENWKILINVLNSSNYELINEINRAQIIDDSLNLARAGYIDYTVALDITNYLSYEHSYFSWKTFFDSVAYLSRRIEGQPKIKSHFRRHVRRLIFNAYEKFGFKEDTSNDSHLDQLMRELIVTYACKYEHEDCITKAREYFDKERITPNIAAAAYCTVIENGNIVDWQYLWKKLQDSVLPSDHFMILKGLGCSKDPAVLEKYLDLALIPDSKIQKTNFAYVLSSIYSSSRIGLETVIKYFETNTEKLYKYLGSWEKIGYFFIELSDYISTKEQIEDLQKSISDKRLAKIQSFLKLALERAQENMKWFEIHSSIIQNWLNKRYETETLR